MPLTRSTSKGAFAHNVRAEIAAGKPPEQAVAIAYSVKREAQKNTAKKMRSGTPSHSSHSEQRSKHYHEKVVAQKTYSGPTMMTQSRSQKIQNDEDWDE